MSTGWLGPLPDVLRALEAEGVTRLLVLPLYPQYSASTTGAVFDAVTAELQRWRRVPELRFVADYHDDGGWLDALEARAPRSPPRSWVTTTRRP